MNWLDKLERKFGRYAIPNLMYYIIILYGVGFVLNMVNGNFYYQYLALDIGAVLRGQIWRLVTFIIQPPSNSLIFIVFAMYLYYMIGNQLERAWGAFRFNVYFFSGMFFHILAAFILYFIMGLSLPMSAWYLNMSLFFAFAAIYPDMEFLVFFILPVKVKWLAILDGLYFLYTVVQAFLPAYGGGILGIVYKANAVAAVVSILNFVIFFFGSRNVRPYTPKQMKRKHEFKKNIKQARKTMNYGNGASHRCAVCGRTDLDDAGLEFRYCSKCNGNYEYCQDHLFTHTHVR
ncbi:MAG: rhomboid family intramembrane serine protease [Lachnospiraceae bacterium]